MALRSESSNGHTHADPGEQDLDTLQQLHGYTHEELEYIIRPMAEDGKEAVGSMGDDTPLSVLQDEPRLLYTYFKQRFPQVTNPATDSAREEIVMPLDTHPGPRPPLLEPFPDAARQPPPPRPLLDDSA